MDAKPIQRRNDTWRVPEKRARKHFSLTTRTLPRLAENSVEYDVLGKALAFVVESDGWKTLTVRK